ncbi:translation machinery-associated protein 16 homolog [Macrosteles quadrilineatus]|uniref:translation machinery-associated protein 16 homolog n=1 Tax=Macrosteles quadrilineatus TaxID=74068 RepID=UPI0023E15B3F|nr:translation machinery-associated protein 16 homolog [Macrosteles quadrilineatus]
MGKVKSVSVANLSHPNSRKVRQLTKQAKKESARKKSKMVHQMKLNVTGEKFLWFQNNLPADVSEISHGEIASLIEKYLGRFDEELEQIQLKHSVGQRKNNRQHASREDVIKLTKKQEEEEYNAAGIELPNLLLPVQVEFLRRWNGELRFLQQFKLRRFSREFLKRGCLKSRPASPVESNENGQDINKIDTRITNELSKNNMEIDENK